MQTGQLKRYDGLITFLMAGLLVSLACYFAGIFPGGQYCAIYSDTMDQMASLSAMLAAHLKQGESIFYSMETSLGQNTALAYAFSAYSPFTLLYLFISDVYTATLLGMILKISLSAMLFHLFLQYGMKYRSRRVIFFSLCYGLCGFQYEYMLSTNLLDGLYLLPLVMLVLVRSIEHEKCTALSLAYAVSFMTQFYLGFLIGIYSFVSLIAVLYLRYGRDFIRKKRRFLFHYGISVISALLISMCLLLPAIMFFVNSTGFNTVSLDRNVGFFDILYSLFFGRPTSLKTNIPFLYCGLPVLFLIPVYFADRKRRAKEKALAAAALLSLFASLWIDPLYLFLHAFNRPDGFTVRYAFLYVFLLAFLATRAGMEEDGRLLSGKISGTICYFGVFLLVGEGLILFHDRFGEVADGKGVDFALWGNLILILLWGIVVICLKSEKTRKYAVIGAYMILIAELEAQAWFNCCEQGRTPKENYDSWNRQMEEFLSLRGQDEKKDELYRGHLGNAPYYNLSAMYGYPGAAQFVSSNNAALYKLLARLGDAVNSVRYTQTGATDLTDMIFGIRYRGVLTLKDRTEPGADGPSFEIYERALPLGYMVSETVLEPFETDGDVFANQNRLLSVMCGQTVQAMVKTDVFGYEADGMQYEQTEDGFSMRTEPGYEFGDLLLGIPDVGYERAYAYFQLLPFRKDGAEQALPADMACEVTQFSPADRKGSGAREVSVLENAIIELTRDGNAFVMRIQNYEGADKAYSYKNQYFYYEDEAVLDAVSDFLKPGGWKVTKSREGLIEAAVTATEQKPVLFISIPYERGWYVTVDGMPAQIQPVVMDAFMGVVLAPGEHRIRLEYKAPGAEAGMILAGMGGVLLLLMWMIERKQVDSKTQ